MNSMNASLHSTAQAFCHDDPRVWQELIDSAAAAGSTAAQTIINDDPSRDHQSRLDAALESLRLETDPGMRLAASLFWTGHCANHDLFDDIDPFLESTEELLTDDCPDISRAWASLLRGLRYNSLSDWKNAIRSYHEATDIAPPESELFRYACSYAINKMYTCELGNHIGPLTARLRSIWPSWDQQPDFLVHQLTDAVSRGRLDDSTRIVERINGHLNSTQGKQYALARALYELMYTHLPGQHRACNRPLRQDRTWLKQSCGIDINSYLLTTRALLANDPQQALSHAARYFRDLGQAASQLVRFDGYDLVRALLANRDNHAAAIQLEHQQMARGDHHWDSLFMARIHLLRGSHQEAQSLISETCQKARSLSAEERLRFELQLCIEVPVSEMTRWLFMLEHPTLLNTETITTDEGNNAVERILGNSSAIRQVRTHIRRLANLSAPVLISGQTGTGKELVAQALHHSSTRSNDPFLAVNCAAVSSSILIAELFGCVRGAFTGANTDREGLFSAAGEGTLFLDEITEIKPSLQGALLRVLETGDFLPVGSTTPRQARCRIIAASNSDLRADVNTGRLREDLYYRLHRFIINLPPLHQRREDIVILARHFLMQSRAHDSIMDASLIEALTSYNWPGNIRELRTVIENLVAFGIKAHYNCDDLILAMPHLCNAEQMIKLPAPPITQQSMPSIGRPSTHRRRQAHIAELEALFKRFGHLTTGEASRALQLSRPTVTTLMRTLCASGYIHKVTPNRSPNSHYYEIL